MVARIPLECQQIASLLDTFLDAPPLTPTRGVTTCQHALSASPPRLARDAAEGRRGGFPRCSGHPVSPLKSVGERAINGRRGRPQGSPPITTSTPAPTESVRL